MHRGSKHVVSVYVAAGLALYDQVRGRQPLVKDELGQPPYRVRTVAVHGYQRVAAPSTQLQTRVVPCQARRHPPGSAHLVYVRTHQRVGVRVSVAVVAQLLGRVLKSKL